MSVSETVELRKKIFDACDNNNMSVVIGVLVNCLGCALGDLRSNDPKGAAKAAAVAMMLIGQIADVSSLTDEEAEEIFKVPNENEKGKNNN